MGRVTSEYTTKGFNPYPIKEAWLETAFKYQVQDRREESAIWDSSSIWAPFNVAAAYFAEESQNDYFWKKGPVSSDPNTGSTANIDIRVCNYVSDTGSYSEIPTEYLPKSTIPIIIDDYNVRSGDIVELRVASNSEPTDEYRFDPMGQHTTVTMRSCSANIDGSCFEVEPIKVERERIAIRIPQLPVGDVYRLRVVNENTYYGYLSPDIVVVE